MTNDELAADAARRVAAQMFDYAGRKATILKAIEDALTAAKFAPLGDNHHNASACPYCSPKLTSPPAPSGWQQRIARLRAALELAKPTHYAAECLVCDDGDRPCPTLAFIARIDALLVESEGWQNAKDALPSEQRTYISLYVPYPLSEVSVDDFEEWMKLVIRKLRSGVREADASPAKDPITAAVDAQLDPLKRELVDIGHKLAKETR